jgi:hypothetical protein
MGMMRRAAKLATGRARARKSAAQVKVQPSPVPEGLVENYAGRWVAVRDQKVIADAEDLETLKARDEVGEDAMPIFVPDAADPF